MTTNYVRGKAWEYRVRDRLKDAGWFVIQAGGSKGVADLVALRFATAPILVQAKRASGPLAPMERAELLRVALSLGAIPIHVHPGSKRGQMVWRKLTGSHFDSFELWNPEA